MIYNCYKCLVVIRYRPYCIFHDHNTPVMSLSVSFDIKYQKLKLTSVAADKFIYQYIIPTSDEIHPLIGSFQLPQEGK